MTTYLTLGAKLRFTAAALFSMLMGAQLVHAVYRPLDDMEQLVEAEVKKMRREQSLHQKQLQDLNT